MSQLRVRALTSYDWISVFSAAGPLVKVIKGGLVASLPAVWGHRVGSPCVGSPCVEMTRVRSPVCWE